MAEASLTEKDQDAHDDEQGPLMADVERVARDVTTATDRLLEAVRARSAAVSREAEPGPR